MSARRIRRSVSLATKSAQLAWAAPQVVAHRVTRMALAGSDPSSRDRREFALMGAEKSAAFLASWNAMAMQAARAQQAFLLSWFKAVWMPWLGTRMTAASVANQMQNAALGIAASGLGPVHRRAVANARRLAFVKRP